MSPSSNRRDVFLNMKMKIFTTDCKRDTYLNC